MEAKPATLAISRWPIPVKPEQAHPCAEVVQQRTNKLCLTYFFCMTLLELRYLVILRLLCDFLLLFMRCLPPRVLSLWLHSCDFTQTINKLQLKSFSSFTVTRVLTPKPNPGLQHVLVTNTAPGGGGQACHTSNTFCFIIHPLSPNTRAPTLTPVDECLQRCCVSVINVPAIFGIYLEREQEMPDLENLLDKNC